MTDDEVSVIDRRQNGIKRVQISDGNGGKLDVYTMSAARIKVWGGAVIAMLTVGGMIFAAVRFGVGVEVHQAIDAESRSGGIIDAAIDAKANEFLEEVQGVIQDDLGVFERKLDEDHDAVVRIETRQIAIDEKVDANQEELLRAIERVGGGSG